MSAGEGAQETGGSRKIVKSSARSLDIVLRAHGVEVAGGNLDGEGWWCVVAGADNRRWSPRNIESAATMLVDGSDARWCAGRKLSTLSPGFEPCASFKVR